MKFHDKFDFLMNITQTSNSALSVCISLDASHISRLRRGERKLVKDAEYLKKMALYFARHCTEDYKKKAISEFLGDLPDLFLDEEKTAAYIYEWMLGDSYKKKVTIDDFLANLSKTETLLQKNEKGSTKTVFTDFCEKGTALFYGYEGKREAALVLLSLIIQSNKIGTLHLYSDESMEWMSEDFTFMSKWDELMKQTIAKGNRINIIHTLNRNLDDLLEGLNRWMPLYLTGAIEPYYYPKIRDGIFKRTIYVFPGVAALVSSSLDDMSDKALSILLQNPPSINAIFKEYNAYLELCRPLMRIFNLREGEEYLRALDAFEKNEAKSIMESEHISMVTMPKSVSEPMFARITSERKEKITEHHLERTKRFKENILHNPFYESVYLPNIKEVLKGNVKVGLKGVADFEGLTYTPAEYKAHLENVIYLLEEFDNYFLILNNRIKNENYTIYVREDQGTFIFKTTSPAMIFVIKEKNITATFWDHLKTKLGNDQMLKREKMKTIKRLKSLVKEIT